VTFEQVYDLYAIRIVFNPTGTSKEAEREECYRIFSIITNIYRFKPDRVRDWVKTPKSNGYEALHCTLLSDNGIWVEVQIRTKRMDDIAEKGIAAHWAYKKDGYAGENDSEMDKWLGKVQEILVNPDVNALELLDIIHNDLTTSDIVVFTPRGEQKTIQKGATALDFAYMIHSQIGSKAIAAKVNMKLVPLNYVLRTGDQVEIISAEDEKPKKEWLQFLQTRQARNMVVDYFKTEKASLNESGKAELDEKLKAAGYKTSEAFYKQLCANLSLRNLDDLYFRYSLGLIKYDLIAEAAAAVKVKEKPKISWFKRESKEKIDNTVKKDRTSYIIGSPADKHKYVIATCCNPIAGDPVIGFLAPDGTVTVHSKTCDIAEGIASKHSDCLNGPTP